MRQKVDSFEHKGHACVLVSSTDTIAPLGSTSSQVIVEYEIRLDGEELPTGLGLDVNPATWRPMVVAYIDNLKANGG